MSRAQRQEGPKKRTMGCACHLLLCAALGSFATLAHGPAAYAGKANRKAFRRVAVFPLVVEGEVSSGVVHAVQTALVGGIAKDPAIRILHGEELRAKLRRSPHKAVTRCHRRREAIACFARLAVRSGADEILVGRVKSGSSGPALLLLAIKRNRAVDPRAQMRLPELEDVDIVFTEELLRTIYRLPEAPKTIEATPAEVVPAAPIVSVRKDRTLPPPPPQVPRVPWVVPPAATVAVSEASTLPGMPVRVEAHSRAKGQRSWLAYLGVTVGVLGLGGVGYGIYAGSESSSLRATLQRDGDLVQRQAIRRAEQSNRLATHANMAFAVGGAIVAVGMGILGLDLLGD